MHWAGRMGIEAAGVSKPNQSKSTLFSPLALAFFLHTKMLLHMLTLKRVVRKATGNITQNLLAYTPLSNKSAKTIWSSSKTTHTTGILCKTNPLRITNCNLHNFSTHTKMAKTALVIVAEGSEEIEAVTPIDTLRRAGVKVTVAGLQNAGLVTMSRDVGVGAEVTLKEALASGPFDAVILPGGAKGSEAFVQSEEVGNILKEQEQAGRLVAAICAAPTALHKHNICVGKAITSYPAMKEKMIVDGKYQYKEERVVVDGNLITSRGPGTSLEFSLALVAYLVGQEKADEVGKAMLVK